MIAGNEQDVIARAIESVHPFVDEVIVGCNGQDATEQIAQEHGATTFRDTWDEDFARLRNAALARATSDYVLSLDCDEWLEPIHAKALRTLATKTAPERVWLTRIETPDDREGVNVDKHFYGARFFPRRDMSWVRPIHEQVIYRGNQDLTQYSPTNLVVIHHDGYMVDRWQAGAKHERNLRILLREVETHPTDANCWHELGRQYHVVGQWDKALDAFEHSLALFRERELVNGTVVAGICVLAAGAAVHAGKPDRGLAVTSEALKHHPNYAGLLNVRGVCLRALGRHNEAIICFHKALALKGAFSVYEDEPSTSGWRAFWNLGHAYLEIGEPVRAWECFRQEIGRASCRERV